MARSSLFGHVKVRTGHASDLEVSTPLAVLVGTVLGRFKKGRLRVCLSDRNYISKYTKLEIYNTTAFIEHKILMAQDSARVAYYTQAFTLGYILLILKAKSKKQK